MKVTYQTCCSVDVHKSFLVATIVKTTGGIAPSYQKKRFSTLKRNMNHLLNVAARKEPLSLLPV